MYAESPLMPSAAQPVRPLLVTPREAAKVLSVCEKTLWTLTKCGELPAVRIGRRGIRYDVRDLQDFIDRQKTAGSRPAAE